MNWTLNWTRSCARYLDQGKSRPPGLARSRPPQIETHQLPPPSYRAGERLRQCFTVKLSQCILCLSRRSCFPVRSADRRLTRANNWLSSWPHSRGRVSSYSPARNLIRPKKKHVKEIYIKWYFVFRRNRQMKLKKKVTQSGKIPGASWISWRGDAMLLATFEPAPLETVGALREGRWGRESDTGWLIQQRGHWENLILLRCSRGT